MFQNHESRPTLQNPLTFDEIVKANRHAKFRAGVLAFIAAAGFLSVLFAIFYAAREWFIPPSGASFPIFVILEILIVLLMAYIIVPHYQFVAAFILKPIVKKWSECSPVAGGDCAGLNQLFADCPVCEDYRKKVLHLGREFVNLDERMLRQFKNELRIWEMKEEVRKKQKVECDKLYLVNDPV